MQNETCPKCGKNEMLTELSLHEGMTDVLSWQTAKPMLKIPGSLKWHRPNSRQIPAVQAGVQNSTP